MASILYVGYHGNGRHFEFVQPPQKLPHTTVDIPTKWILIWLPNHGYQFPTSKSTWIFLQILMKGIPKKFESPLFCFHGNCGKVCPTESDLFGLSRSTRYGCCSYQVSSISVRRVTLLWSFLCFSIFLAFWPFPWQRQPFWKFRK